MIDPTTAAGLVAREVRTGARDGTATKVVVARRVYPTDQVDLWDAVTNRDRIPRWFMPVSGDLSVGGRYQLEGNAGGVVEQCDEPESFSVTWEFDEMLSWLRVTLSPHDDGTLLELLHEAHVEPEMWAQFGPGAGGVGWDLGLVGLGLHVASGEPVDPAEAAAFHTTPEGIEFTELAAAGWADAAIRDGDDPDEAREAAARTVAFYTVEPDGEAAPDPEDAEGH